MKEKVFFIGARQHAHTAVDCLREMHQGRCRWTVRFEREVAAWCFTAKARDGTQLCKQYYDSQTITDTPPETLALRLQDMANAILEK